MRSDVGRWPGMRSEYSWIPPGDAPSQTGPHQVGVSFSQHRTVTASPYLLFEADVRLSARVHRATDDLYERQPAVLVTGSWLTVKEQMADHYARAPAERGYTAITFDFAGFGQSSGGPRQAEIPARKFADITAAARQVSSLSCVRPGAVGYHHIRGAEGGETWEVYGHYTARLADGKITELTLRVFYQEGNLGLPALATERAATSPRRSAG